MDNVRTFPLHSESYHLVVKKKTKVPNSFQAKYMKDLGTWCSVVYHYELYWYHLYTDMVSNHDETLGWVVSTLPEF